MKIEVIDIAENDRAFGESLDLPAGATLRQVFQHDKDLAAVMPNIGYATVNGKRIDDWLDARMPEDAKVVLTIVPRAAGALALLNALSIIVKIVSVVFFIVGLFTKPKSPKLDRGAGESATYSFEGLRDTFAPGEPVKVIYGRHRTGGQVLMYYLDLTDDGRGLEMSMLLSLCHGPVSSVGNVELNDIGITQIQSASTETRLGASSQSVISGFEIIKNTFHDGREITDQSFEQNSTKTSCSQLVYRTQANDVNGLELFVAALQGLTCVGLSSGRHYGQWSRYTIEFNKTEASTCGANEWTLVETRTVSGNFERTYWDKATLNFPQPGQYDIRLTWIFTHCHPCCANPGLFAWRLWLQDVTEIRGPSGPFSGEVVLAIKAAPTKDLHGGRPNVTALVEGRTVDVYTSPTSFTNRFTRNPAWAVRDYMTNSIYGMGGYVSGSDLDIQSFIDFATLADSLTETCPTTDPATIGGGAGRNGCVRLGTPSFHCGEAVVGGIGFENDDVIEQFHLRSKFDGQPQYGVALCRVCCPPENGCGVDSGEFFCEQTDNFAWVTVVSGSPVFGLAVYVRSGSNQDNFSGYGLVVDTASGTVSAERFTSQPLTGHGTILQARSWSIVASQFLQLIVTPGSCALDPYPCPEGPVRLRGFVGATQVISVVDNPPDCIPIQGTSWEGLNGPFALPTQHEGDHHVVMFNDFRSHCGLCYASNGVTETGTFDFTCQGVSPCG